MAFDYDELCFKYDNGHLAYKAGGDGNLIYKGAGDYALIYIEWGSGNRDLDICGYWTATSGNKVGWSYNSSFNNPPYIVEWSSGDYTGWGGMERLALRLSPWSTSPRTFRVHFNYFGETEESPVCTVTARKGAVTITKSNQRCGTNSGSRATTSDPYCTITFDEHGTPLSIT